MSHSCRAILTRRRHFYVTCSAWTNWRAASVTQYDIVWFHKGNAEMHLIHEPDSPQKPGDAPRRTRRAATVSWSRHFALAVRQMPTPSCDVLDEHGIAIVLGPRPRGDGAIQMFCYDPDGH